ncbi:helix-turn-helix domain-containing protein [Ligilactobacillus acidipiscis]|uniref:helix-turn-helix domain-containing protein n=1 Tax=Ligilactobacillus acidipiscis TaxID=89059 RepID=UPI00386F6E49
MPKKMDEKELKDLGRRISTIRIQLGLTMKEFIERIDGKNGTGQSGTVNNWESGKNAPNKKRLKRIAELGNVSVEYLLHGTEFISIRDYRKLVQKNKEGSANEAESRKLRESLFESQIQQEKRRSKNESTAQYKFKQTIETLLDRDLNMSEKFFLTSAINLSLTLVDTELETSSTAFGLLRSLELYADPDYEFSADYTQENAKKEMQEQFNNLLDKLR